MIALSITHTHAHTYTKNVTQELIYNLAHVLRNKNMPVHVTFLFLLSQVLKFVQL